jgi:hypothetical protein
MKPEEIKKRRFDKKFYTTIKGVVVISDERILEIFNEQKKDL